MIHKLTRALAVTAVAGALAAPAASAMLPGPDAAGGSAGSGSLPQLAAPVRSGGFNFGDAAVGAGAMAGLLAAGGAGGRLLLHRLRRAQMSPLARG